MKLSGAAHALRVGLSLSGSERERRGQFWPLALATLCLGLALIMVSLTVTVYRGIESRGAAFAPVTSGAGAPIAYAVHVFDREPLTSVAIQPVDARSTPPPGLTAWPAAGQAWVSPEVALQYPLGSQSPYGRVAGIIDAGHLSRWDEHWVYFNPAQADLRALSATEPDSAQMVTGFGGGPGGSSLTFSESMSVFVGLVVTFLVVPAAALLWAACGINLQRRRATVEAFSVMGAPRRFKAALLFGECVAPVTAGVAACVAVLCVLVSRDIPLAGTGATLLREDSLAALPGSLAAALVAALALIAVFGARATVLSRRVSATARRPLSVPAWCAGLAPLAGLALWQQWYAVLPDLTARQIAVFVLVLVALTTAPALLWLVVKTTAQFMVVRVRSVHALVGLRQVLASSGRVVVVALALMMALSIFGVTQLYTSFYGAESATARAASERIGSSVMKVTFSFKQSAAHLPDIARSQPHLAYLEVRSNFTTSAVTTYTVQGSCSALAALSVPCPATNSPVAVRDTPHAALSYFTQGSRLEVQRSNPTPGNDAATPADFYLVANSQGHNIDVTALQATAHAYLGQATAIAAPWLGALNTQHMQWLTLFAPATMLMLTLALSLNAWSSLLEHSTAIAHLTMLWRSPRLVWSVSAAVLLLPLLAGLAGGLLLYQFFGQVFGSSYQGMHVDGPTFAALGCTTFVCLVAFWSLASAHLQRRIARHPLGVVQ